MPNLKGLMIKLPPLHIEALDKLVGQKMYANRSEAIRAAVRDLLIDEYWKFPEVEKNE